MPLINCEINNLLTWSEECITVTWDYRNDTDNKPKCAITGTKLYVSVLTLLTQDNEKLLQPL